MRRTLHTAAKGWRRSVRTSFCDRCGEVTSCDTSCRLNAARNRAASDLYRYR